MSHTPPTLSSAPCMMQRCITCVMPALLGSELTCGRGPGP